MGLPTTSPLVRGVASRTAPRTGFSHGLQELLPEWPFHSKRFDCEVGAVPSLLNYVSILQQVDGDVVSTWHTGHPRSLHVDMESPCVCVLEGKEPWSPVHENVSSKPT